MVEGVELRGVMARLGSFTLGPISTVFPGGAYTVILGPTGSGKSSVLKVIAGIYRPQRGSVLIDGVDVTREPPERRGVSYVPQGYAVFDHMTVYENIEYGLKIRGVPRDERRKLVLGIAHELGIEHILNRRAHNLSGGEQQRVALARALVVSPRVLLLDEPLSMLDMETRDRILPMLKQLPLKYGVTVVHVTHDWDEAYSLADKIIVINRGLIVEEGDPESVFNNPRSEFTARFLGFRNIIRGLAEVHGTQTIVRINDEIKLISTETMGGDVYVVIRPEWVRIVDDGYNGVNKLRGVVDGVMRTRVGYQVTVNVGHGLTITVLTNDAVKVGQVVTLFIPPERVHLIRL
ncbi:ABC transporter ATP-binding protein [Vulcanisaeta thermophila]|uniref:ABC transporter ATP-binding protein n=1 Tax=Vulcanisaeta thermophila TaxID=867917 RepID=UPI001EE3508A|nr:ABC transporter ATP-binding protein [Vulcanisaeta thermophila]